MQYKDRIPEELFNKDGHYLGKPADFDDRIIQRRLNLVNSIDNFIGKDLTLLDIGCGNGASMFGLSEKMKYCLGLEITDEHLAEFEAFKSNRQVTNCEYKVMDIEKDNLPNQFDRIVSFEVIEHLVEEKGVEFYYKSLKQGGLMAISVPNKWWIFETHGAKLPLLPWNRIPFFSWLPQLIHEKYANARIYTKKRITNLLKKYGFAIVSVQYITAPMDVLPKGKFKNFVIKNLFNSDSTLIPFKSTSIFVVAKKI
jgi:2-polyprenyl-3-methyl-5-hydroxy-6-metoxy-1,4-benzoquinol methylase